MIETGIAHGGTAILFASILDQIKNKGKVIAIDVKIRSKNLKAIRRHSLSKYIKLFEGSSVDIKILKNVRKNIKQDDKVFVFLDSNHTYEHVYKELIMYSKLVTKNSYIVACDGVMNLVNDTPREKGLDNK